MPAILMTWLLIAVIHHTALGLQVGIGDQKRAATKLAELIIIPVLLGAGGCRDCRDPAYRLSWLRSLAGDKETK